MSEYRLQVKGLKCPIPVLKTRKILKKMKSGDTLIVVSDDMGSKTTIPSLIIKSSCILEELRVEDGILSFFVKKK